MRLLLPAFLLLLTACFHEVALTPQAPVRSVDALPMSARIVVDQSVSGGKVPIRFDVRQAAVGYFKDRGTFREVVESGGDAVLTLSSRFALNSEVSFHYDFDVRAALRGGGTLLGSYHAECSAKGGSFRLSSDADVAPMTASLSKCLGNIAERIEADAPAILARLGGKAPAVSAGPAIAEFPVLAPGFAAPERPDDLAVIVGVESYSDIATKAPYAERDAEAFKAYVRALGVPERNIVLLKGAKAGKASIEKNLESWLPRLAKPNSRVYFYFSGHGAPDVKTGQAYLVPWDGDPNFLENTAYPVARLYRKLGELPAKQVLVALDSCFSGAGGRSVLASGARPLVTKIDAGAVPARLTVLAASASNEISGSLDDKGHGAFTYFLLQGLDAGKSTPQALADYLTPRVQDEARRLNRDQTPQLQGDGSWSLR